MATSSPAQLTRALRRGSVPTRTLPPSDHVMGPSSAAADDDAMAELAAALGPVGGTPPEAAAPAAAPVHAAPAAPLAPLATAPTSAEPAPVQAGPVPAAPLRGTSRAARFGGSGADPLAAPAAPAKAPAAAAEAGSPASRPWGNFMDPDRAPEVVNARQAMAAAKVVAPLVAAVSFNPGSNASSKDMSKSLSTMLVAVHRASTQVAERWSQQYGKDVPAWSVSQLMQTMADVVARRWERSGSADIEQMTDLMCGLLTQQDGDIARMLIEAADQAYVEATTAETAANRVAVSTAGAGWALYDWITHDNLAITGEVPHRYYSYDLEPSDVVARMLRLCVSFCRSMPLNVNHADMRVAHMQASIRRMANLMGAEYVAQTRVVMNWIGDQNITDEEFAARKHAAAQQFDSRILPHVFEWARRSFLRVEQGAFSAIEDLNEKQNPDGGSSSAARPLQQ